MRGMDDSTENQAPILSHEDGTGSRTEPENVMSQLYQNADYNNNDDDASVLEHSIGGRNFGDECEPLGDEEHHGEGFLSTQDEEASYQDCMSVFQQGLSTASSTLSMGHGQSALVSLGHASDNDEGDEHNEICAAPMENTGFGEASLGQAAQPQSSAPGQQPSPALLTSSQADLRRLDLGVRKLGLAHPPHSEEAPGERGLAPSAIQETLSVAETDVDDSWAQHGKHFFILTESGRPVWTYHGEEDGLAGLMALITALVSVIQDQGDSIQHVVSGRTLVVFLHRGPLILVAASRLGEPLAVLSAQLHMLHRQVVVIVTTALEKMLNRNPAYDARTLLEGVGDVLRALVGRMRLDAAYLMGGAPTPHAPAPLMPVPVSAVDRAGATMAVAEAVRTSGALYGALMSAGGAALAVVRAPNRGLPPLDGLDLMLLDNFVACSPAIRHGGGEACCPICLPAFNPAAFLHAYITYIDPATVPASTSQLSGSLQGVTPAPAPSHAPHDSAAPRRSSSSGSGAMYLVLLAASSDSFHALSAARVALETSLARGNVLTRLHAAAATAAATATSCLAPQAPLEAQGAEGPAAECPSQTAPTTAGAASSSSASSSASPAAAGAAARTATGSGLPHCLGAVSIEALPKPLGGKFGNTALWHFMAHTTQRQQLVRAAFGPPFVTSAGRQRLCAAYGQLHACVWDTADRTKPNKLVWLATEKLTLLALTDAEMELYIVCDPLTDQATALKLGDALRRYLDVGARVSAHGQPGTTQLLLPPH